MNNKIDNEINTLQTLINNYFTNLNYANNEYDNYKKALQLSNTKLLNFINKHKKSITYNNDELPLKLENHNLSLPKDFNYSIYQKKIELEKIVEKQYSLTMESEEVYLKYMKFKDNMIQLFENIKNVNIIKLYNTLKSYKIEGLGNLEMDYFQIKFKNTDNEDKLSINITYINNQFEISKLRIKANRKIIPFKIIYIQDINDTLMFIISYCVKVNKFRK